MLMLSFIREIFTSILTTVELIIMGFEVQTPVIVPTSTFFTAAILPRNIWVDRDVCSSTSQGSVPSR